MRATITVIVFFLRYKKAKDKKQAAYDILNIEDARTFYEASGVSKTRAP